MEEVIPFPSSFLNQLKGRVKFDQLIQIQSDPVVFRGHNKSSGYLWDIVILPQDGLHSVVLIGLAEREYQINTRAFLFHGVFTIYQLLEALRWRANEVLEFEY